jgi:hypothetical protein
MSNASSMNPIAVEMTSNYTQLFSYVGNFKYSGMANPGTISSEPKWRIQRSEYINSQLVSVKFALGRTDFSFIWDERETLDYV